jgi:hypothetical protein
MLGFQNPMPILFGVAAVAWVVLGYALHQHMRPNSFARWRLYIWYLVLAALGIVVLLARVTGSVL